MKLLHIDSSILGENSISRTLSAKLVGQIRQFAPATEINYLDLAANPIKHLSSELFAAQAKSLNDRTEEERADVELSEKTMADFLAADVLVIGAPMYNFGISTQLKAWIDRIAVAGKTFRYTANGPEGLVRGKKVYIMSSRGSIFNSGDDAMLYHHESHLSTVFNFLGITDITFIRAEGVSMGPEFKEKALAAADVLIGKAVGLAAA